jgi:hypothetical protein
VQGVFLFATACRLALGFSQPPIQWVLGVKQKGCEADHSPPFISGCVSLLGENLNTIKYNRDIIDARFEDFTAVNIQVDVFWAVIPCSVAIGCHHFGGPPASE